MTKSTPKIRGYLARDVFSGVLLYRKSNKLVYLVSLDYKNRKDKVAVGSKFSGTIYPNRSALSPDGKDFLYFAMGKGQGDLDKKFYCWTAICNPPKIKANLFMPHNTTYSGGGYFIDESNIYIAGGTKAELSLSKGIDKDKYFGRYKIIFDPAYNNGRWDSQKYGWIDIEKNKYGFATSWAKANKDHSITKKVKKNWIKSGEFSMHEYTITGKKEEALFEQTDNINWADIDNYGRLILCSGSILRIYENYRPVVSDKPKEFDLEELINGAA
ncbi:MAG: hypothetical protein ABI543_06315 [Ignavibacteria bacterium]